MRVCCRLSSSRVEPPHHRPSARDRRTLLVFLKRFENQLAELALCRRIDDGPEQGEAAPLAVDAVLPGRERDVATVAAAPVPDRKANQLQPLERPLGEVHFTEGP